MRTIRVLVVDDSPFVCRLLTSYLHSSPDLQVVGTALNGAQTLKLIEELRPDVLTLDLEMPGTNGIELLEHIMHEYPTPTVVISGVNRQASEITLRALDLGAVDFILKYIPGLGTDPDALREEIVRKVYAASQIKVTRFLHMGSIARDKTVSPVSSAEAQKIKNGLPPEDVVVIGSSTGGPLALCELLSNLPDDFSDAVIIVQHMPRAFTAILATQLSRYTNIKVKEAENNDLLASGVALVAPGGYHTVLGKDSRVRLDKGPEVRGYRPSIDVTMQSVARVYGSHAKGIVLTGIGNDGALGLFSIHLRGGKTFVQDAASCVVNSMPQKAIEKGIVDYVAPPWRIARLLVADKSGLRGKRNVESNRDARFLKINSL